ncbi:MAG: DUF2807 domain-containing protein [Rikenellaceae bacterium]|nr:DUF2807 domain-containing protein [Rikenellaceae bacterium]
MKKSILILTAILMMAGSLSAAQVTKEFSRGLTTEISIDGAFRVVLSDKYRNNVKIVYDDALANYIATEIKGKQLKISYERGANKTFKKNNVDLPTVYIDRNFVSYLFKDAVDATSTEVIEGAELKLRIQDNSALRARIAVGKLDMGLSDAAIYEGEITAREAKVALSGSATATLTGSTTKLSVTAQGSSTFNGESLINASSAAVSASGSSIVAFCGKGSVKVNCSSSSAVTADVNCKALNVNAGGSSTVTLKGSSKTLKLSASGSSRIDQANYQNDMSAKVSVSGTANATVTSRGAMNITASGAATLEAQCGGNLSVKASGTSTVIHSRDAKLVKLTLKDQATVKAEEEKQPAVNVYTSPYGNTTPQYMQR